MVLDNCEHLIEPAAAAAEAVLGFGGRVRILATSRERLGVRGERVWPVSPLDVTAARQLFVDRARAVSPGFDPHSADATAVDRVVDEVDRLPLAIEMAAARVGAMGMAELAALVTTRLDLLRSPQRGTTDRHRTLAAVIAWSEELLDDSERTAFAELSAFAGPALGADLDGVIDGGDALDRVCRLVDRSLVIAEVSTGPTRYRMLETVRRHAAASAGNDEALRLRHATWFTETAEEADALLRTPAEREGHETIEARVDELRAAHRWARSQAPHLAARLTAALQLHAHSRLWPEPAQWAVELAPHHRRGRAARVPGVGGDGERGSPPGAVRGGDVVGRAGAAQRRSPGRCRRVGGPRRHRHVPGRPVPLPESGTPAPGRRRVCR